MVKVPVTLDFIKLRDDDYIVILFLDGIDSTSALFTRFSENMDPDDDN